MNDTGYLRADGSPNLPLLTQIFSRCSPTVPGGMDWLDNVRFCRWPGQFNDGKKHDSSSDPAGAAKPWDHASDVRPFVVDDLINERKATLSAAFWKAMASSVGAADSESSGYAVALLEWLIFTKMFSHLIDEIDLAADYQEHVGWCLLAPRWKRELGLKRYKLKLADIAQAAQGAPPDSPLSTLTTLILDPTQETAAVEALKAWYGWYCNHELPPDLQGKVPTVTDAQARRAVQELRAEGEATTALPFVCRNEPEIHALKPYTEAVIPPEITNENEIVFLIERVSEAELRGRIRGEDYNPAWVEAALKFKGKWSNSLPVGNPVGPQGFLGGSTQPSAAPELTNQADGAVEVVYAIYRAADADDIPSFYCTVFHRSVTSATGSTADLFACHDVVESAGGQMPYVALTRERWSRSLASSRGVPEMAHTQQNLVKGILDGIIDRQSITLLPPVNVYESPTGTKYKFGPATQNYVRQGKEPGFMQMPAGQGMADSVEVYTLVSQNLDNRFACMSPNVPAPRQQTNQEHAVRRFLAGWTKAFKQILWLYQEHGDDAEFALVTGAPPGWLDQNRDTPGLLVAALDFDVRELDSELMMKRIEAMNSIVLPNDVLGIINRGQWAQEMTRAILGPAMSKRIVQQLPDATAALREKARGEILQMFAGNTPTFVDDKDPTAASLLQFTKEIVTSNPVYMSALTDEALTTLAGPQAQQLAQQMGQNRKPNERFSELLLKWLQNLQFVGVTQVQNKQIGRIGVDPQTGPTT